MNKKSFVLLLAALLVFSTSTAFAASKNTKSKSSSQKQQSASGFGSSLDTETMYYKNPTLNSAISKFKKANYSGCLQELFSYVQIKPEPKDVAVAYYYIAMSYTNIGDSSAAVEAYEKVVELSKDPKLSEYAVKGKDCLTNGPTCAAEKVDDATGKDGEEGGEKKELTEEEKLDLFIQAPYGNGLSPELEQQLKEEKLKRIQDSINNKKKIEGGDLDRIKKFDIENSSSIEVLDKVAKAEPSDKEILNAIKTLREAGVTVTLQASQPASVEKTQVVEVEDKIDVQQATNPNTMVNGYIDPQMAQMSMMLGNNNNNNSMMNMLPFLMQQNQSGQNIDPQVMQAIMMQQMMPSMDFGLNNNNNYN